MNKLDFLNQLLELCEFEVSSLNLSDLIADTPGYDSYSVLTIISFVDEQFGKSISASDFESLTDFQSLIDFIGNDAFSK